MAHKCRQEGLPNPSSEPVSVKRLFRMRLLLQGWADSTLKRGNFRGAGHQPCRKITPLGKAFHRRREGGDCRRTDRPDAWNCHQTRRGFVLWCPRPQSHLKGGYLFLLAINLIQQHLGDLNDFIGQISPRSDHECTQPFQMNRSLGRDKAEFRKVPAQRINRLCPLPHQKIPRPAGHAERLLLRVFHGNRSHGCPRRGLGNSFCIRRIVLLPHHEWFDIDRRDKADIMTQ